MDDWDPYVILGVPFDATRDDIKKQYRALARLYHPDANPGDARAARRFAMVQRAYEALSDPAIAVPDATSTTASASPRPTPAPSPPRTDTSPPLVDAVPRPPVPPPFPAASTYVSNDCIELSASETVAFDDSAQSRKPRLEVVRADVRLDQVIKPGAVYLEVPRYGRVAVKIPAGADTGTIAPGIVRQGDAVKRLAVELRLLPDRNFERRGLHLVTRYPVDAATAWRGLSTTISTPAGPVRVVIPARSRWGDVVTIPCKGIMGGVDGWGSLFVEISRH